MRSAPASSMAWADLRSRTPPAAFTPMSGPTTRRMRATSAAVAPRGRGLGRRGGGERGGAWRGGGGGGAARGGAGARGGRRRARRAGGARGGGGGGRAGGGGPRRGGGSATWGVHVALPAVRP